MTPGLVRILPACTTTRHVLLFGSRTDRAMPRLQSITPTTARLPHAVLPATVSAKRRNELPIQPDPRTSHAVCPSPCHLLLDPTPSPSTNAHKHPYLDDRCLPSTSRSQLLAASTPSRPTLWLRSPSPRLSLNQLNSFSLVYKHRSTTALLLKLYHLCHSK